MFMHRTSNTPPNMSQQLVLRYVDVTRELLAVTKVGVESTSFWPSKGKEVTEVCMKGLVFESCLPSIAAVVLDVCALPAS